MLMKEPITPDLRVRSFIEGHAQAEINLCFTCGSCSVECPVNLASHRLDPRKLVILANLGALDELLTIPEIWYCLTCRRCNQVCPMTVKPADLISYCRRQAFSRKLVSHEALKAYRSLFFQFQKIRWHMVSRCLQDTGESAIAASWNDWLETLIPKGIGKVSYGALFLGSKAFKALAADSKSLSCFTCGECGNVCPIGCDRRVFDPVTIFRMVNLGLAEALLTSPSIWLCIGCRRCTDACSQRVDGHLMIHRLQELAIEEGFVDAAVPFRLKSLHKMITPLFLDNIDELFGFPSTVSNRLV